MTRTALKLKERNRRETEQRFFEFSTVTYDQRNDDISLNEVQRFGI